MVWDRDRRTASYNSFNARDGVDGEYTQRTVGPFATSLEYFHTVRQGDNRAVLAKHADEDDWATACWILKQALPAMITQNNIHGPFPLCHLDLHFNNILLDDNYTSPESLTGAKHKLYLSSAMPSALSSSPSLGSRQKRMNQSKRSVLCLLKR